MVSVVGTTAAPHYSNLNAVNANFVFFVGCLIVHLPHEIMRNANLMQLGNFIDVSLTGHVSGTYAHHQEH